MKTCLNMKTYLNNWAGLASMLWMLTAYLIIHHVIVPNHVVVGPFWLWIFGMLAGQLVPGLVFARVGLRSSTRLGRLSAILALLVFLWFVWYGLFPVLNVLWQLNH
jgi:hypothetical protein